MKGFQSLTSKLKQRERIELVSLHLSLARSKGKIEIEIRMVIYLWRKSQRDFGFDFEANGRKRGRESLRPTQIKHEYQIFLFIYEGKGGLHPHQILFPIISHKITKLPPHQSFPYQLHSVLDTAMLALSEWPSFPTRHILFRFNFVFSLYIFCIFKI